MLQLGLKMLCLFFTSVPMICFLFFVFLLLQNSFSSSSTLQKMASPFVPVPVPMDRALSGASGKYRRPQRASSLGSVSSSSSSSLVSRTAGDEPRGRRGASQQQQPRCGRSRTPPPLPHHSPIIRARVNGSLEPSVEYSSCPRSISDPVGSQQDGERPITPTVLGYEVMEERAKFTVRAPVLHVTDLTGMFSKDHSSFTKSNIFSHMLGIMQFQLRVFHYLIAAERNDDCIRQCAVFCVQSRTNCSNI